MAENDDHDHDRDRDRDRDRRARARVPQYYSQGLSSGLRPPIFEARISQPAMNLARDDPSDRMTLDTASNSKATTDDSVWSFESMRDIHEYIREFNGRRYNAQNTTYFLPAGQSFPTRLFIINISPDEIEYGRLCVV